MSSCAHEFFAVIKLAANYMALPSMLLHVSHCISQVIQSDDPHQMYRQSNFPSAQAHSGAEPGAVHMQGKLQRF